MKYFRIPATGPFDWKAFHQQNKSHDFTKLIATKRAPRKKRAA